MKSQVVYQLAQLTQACFFERVRSYKFLLLLGLTVFMAYLFLPDSNAGYSTFHWAGYRRTYNSHWIGAQMAVQTSIILFFFGFFLWIFCCEERNKNG
ncbi:MAG: hypothetical protein ACFFBD_24790 [Candidatus Hodarchaeota archaeon]